MATRQMDNYNDTLSISLLQPMSLVTAGSISFFGASILLILGFFLPIPLATVFTVITIIWILRHEKFHGQAALGVSLLYLFVGIATGYISPNLAGVTGLEQQAFLLFGIVGGLYTGFERLVSKAASSVRRTSRGSRVARILSSLFGALTVIVFAFRFRQLVSVRSYATIGIVPSVLLNLALQDAELGVIGALVVQITSFASIGLILGLAFLTDSVHHAVSGLRELRGTPSGSDSEDQTRSLNNLRNLTDEQFRSLLERLVSATYEEATWIEQDVNGYSFIYAKSDSEDELIIGKRNRTVPDSTGDFLNEFEHNLNAALQYLGGTPDHISIVTDCNLNKRVAIYLFREGIDVIDASWFEN